MVLLPNSELTYGGKQPSVDDHQRDLAVLTMLAETANRLFQADLASRRTAIEKTTRIAQAIAEKRFSVLYQPIYHLADDSLAGLEALTRFSALPARSPDQWFAEASEVGLGEELEFATAQSALTALGSLPPGVFLSINLSPSSILSRRFSELLETVPLERVVIELTEQSAVSDYIGTSRALKPLRERGLRLAVDDVGAGHSSFRHVVDLQPDVIKLDMSLTRDIHRDEARVALAKALTSFGREVGCEILAEGVETEDELATLRQIGVTKVQGYLVGRPMPVSEAATHLRFQATR